jgi:NADH-quinone oxidoreductase subunit G
MSDKDTKLARLAAQILSEGPVRTPSLAETESADAVLILGEDLTNTAPRLSLSLRQLVHRKASRAAAEFGIPEWNDAATREVIQHEKETLFIATPYETKLDDVAMLTYRAAPDDLARLGFAVANTLDPDAPPVSGLPDRECAMVIEIAQALHRADRPLVVSGTSCASETVMQAAANVAWALSKRGAPVELSFTVPEANSLGLALLDGGELGEALRTLRDGEADTVIILENDLYRRADVESVTSALEKAEHVIILDHTTHATTAQADVMLPVATFAEMTGTFVNNEGRAQRFFQVFVPQGEIQASWRWLRDAIAAAGRPEMGSWRSLDDVTGALAQALPQFEPIRAAAPTSEFKAVGQKIPRESPRYSGRTAIHAAIDVNEPEPPHDPDSALSFSMEGFEGHPPAALIARFWAPGWNSVQALNKFQSEIGGPLQGGDPGQRLVEPDRDAKIVFFDNVPKAYTQRDGEWLVVPVHRIFGSEEQSALAPAIAERAPQPFLAVNPEDASGMMVDEGQELELSLDGTTFHLAVRLFPSLTRGVVGLPVGLIDVPFVDLPNWTAVPRRSEP